MGKIIIINHYGITPDLPGATKHYDMAKYVSKKERHKVEFWMCGYNHHTGKNHYKLKGLRLQASDEESNLKIVRLKSSPYRKSAILRQLNITLFDLLTALKVLFSKNVEAIILSVPPVSIFNVLAIKFRKIKLVTDVEDLWPLFLVEMGLNNQFAINYMETCSNYTYKVSDGIAAVSDGMVNFVKDKVDSKNKEIWLSPLGVNTKNYFNKVKNKSLIEGKPWENDFIIMYVGAHGRANDLSSVLQTIQEFNKFQINTNDGREISFVFIGDGDQKQNLIELSKNLGLGNVYFENAIPSNLVPDYLIHADVCLTNLKKIDSFKLVRPNKIFQYMALSKPIVSGIWGESKTIIEKANSGVYVDFTNYVEAARRIMQLINNKEKLFQYGANGKKYIEKYGNRDIIFETLYTKLIKIIKREK